MSPCHLPHTVNGWPPQSCHQRLISAAWKWIKRMSKKKGRKAKKKWQRSVPSSAKLMVICYIFRDKYEITLPPLRQSFANAIKCRYKSPTLIHLIWGFQALQQQPSCQPCVYTESSLQFSQKTKHCAVVDEEAGTQQWLMPKKKRVESFGDILIDAIIARFFQEASEQLQLIHSFYSLHGCNQHKNSKGSNFRQY